LGDEDPDEDAVDHDNDDDGHWSARDRDAAGHPPQPSDGHDCWEWNAQPADRGDRQSEEEETQADAQEGHEHPEPRQR
jgi:hypothetical protein